MRVLTEYPAKENLPCYFVIGVKRGERTVLVADFNLTEEDVLEILIADKGEIAFVHRIRGWVNEDRTDEFKLRAAELLRERQRSIAENTAAWVADHERDHRKHLTSEELSCE